MEHDTHQNKVLALGITLLASTVFIFCSMQDADTGTDSNRVLRVRDAVSTDTVKPVAGGEKTVATRTGERERSPRLDQR